MLLLGENRNHTDTDKQFKCTVGVLTSTTGTG